MNTNAPENAIISLPEVFTLPSLSDLKTALDACNAENKEVYLDGSQVDNVDGAAAQFLSHCDQFFSDDTRPSILQKPSEALQRALEDLGLSSLIEKTLMSDSDKTDSVVAATEQE